MAEFRMPSLGADMTDGVLLEWLVKPGTTVHKGDIVAVVDTDKAAIEVECFDSGTVRDLLVEPGTRVPVGAPLATITPDDIPATAAPPAVPSQGVPSPGVSPPAVSPPAAVVPAAVVPAGVVPAAVVPAAVVPAVAGAVGSPVTSPLVRRIAADRHVDLAAVHGTGVGGRITRDDVDHAAPAGGPAPGRLRASPRARRLAERSALDLSALRRGGTNRPIRAADVESALAARASAPSAPAPPVAGSGAAPVAGAAVAGVGAAPAASSAAEQAAQRAAAMRGTIAALMARSKREIPHYYLTETIDLSDALDWLHERNRALPVPQRVVPAALLLKAAARAVREVPELNGFWVDDHFLAAPGVHLGVAISLRGGGLVAPAIADADTLPLEELMARLKDLVARTRAGRLRGSELSSPTLTVSNLGEQGVESIMGVIYPPQVALVGFGAIVERPWAVRGLIGVRRLVVASLAADHRATDGATGSRYLRAVTRLLQQPEEL